MMDQPNKEDLLAKWMEGKLTDQELLQTVSSEELDEYKTILDTVDNWEPQGSDTIESRLTEILATQKEAKVVSMDRRKWVMAIAASLALIAVSTFLLLSDSKQVYYAENEVREIILPDNTTRVILSPGSKLSYDDFDKENRQVEIAGRVYFDVTEKGPFKVSYAGGSVDVLGTQFEVAQMDDFFETTCYEGLVQIKYQGNIAEAAAKDRFTQVKGNLLKSQINSTKPSWIDQEMEVFENAALIKVIKVIESRYKVKVDKGQVDLDRRFTGSIPTNNLEQACKKVFSPLGIQYKIDDKQVFLSE